MCEIEQKYSRVEMQSWGGGLWLRVGDRKPTRLEVDATLYWSRTGRVLSDLSRTELAGGAGGLTASASSRSLVAPPTSKME